ncbi:MAG: response regulator [Dehalococcoidia bacterium]|nr:response regulator [Dehalococcoidia bacterium]
MTQRAVVLTAELIVESRIRAAAVAAGWTVAPAATGPAALDAIALHRPALVIVDVSAPDADIPAILAAAGTATVVAFGRHTNPLALQAARRAGIGRVVTQGELSAALPAIFARPTAAATSKEAS